MEVDFSGSRQRPHGFFSRVKIFHRSSQIVSFLTTTKHSKVIRLAFDHAQVLYLHQLKRLVQKRSKRRYLGIFTATLFPRLIIHSNIYVGLVVYVGFLTDQ